VCVKLCGGCVYLYCKFPDICRTEISGVSLWWSHTHTHTHTHSTRWRLQISSLRRALVLQVGNNLIWWGKSCNTQLFRQDEDMKLSHPVKPARTRHTLPTGEDLYPASAALSNMLGYFLPRLLGYFPNCWVVVCV